MNKNCARPDCGKVVYPLEELKCLDKVWHKQCFKCGVCGMVLNMKNYKGYDKIPYCEAHYPKTKASVVIDTPENRRLAETTKNQSLVKYHEEFERMKGKKTDVVDDAETQRHLKNTQVISSVAYHGESERKQNMEQARPPLEETLVHRERKISNGTNGYSTPMNGSTASAFSPSGESSESGELSDRGAVMGLASYYYEQAVISARPAVQNQSRQVGSISDYDPLNGQFSSIVTGRSHGTVTATTTPNAAKGPSSSSFPSQQLSPTQQTRSAPAYSNAPGSAAQVGHQLKSPTSPPANTGASAKSPKFPTGPMFRAIYDYTASDTDEVSFKEGDFIVNCKAVDDGWMTGSVQRTGQWGMLPANYVERVQ